MAYLIDPLEEKKRQDAAQGGLGTSGVVGSSVTGAGSQGDAVVDTKAPTSSGFVNLQGYLDANKGAGETAATRMTNKISGDVDSFSQKAVDTAQKAEKEIKDTASSADASSKTIAGGLASGQKNYGEAGNFLNSSYGTPTNNYGTDLKTEMTSLNDQLGKVDENATQQTLLQETYGKNGNYSAGFGALDTFLIGNDQNAQKKLSDVKAKTGDVQKSYDGGMGKISAAEAQAKSSFDASKNNLRSSIASQAKAIDENAFAAQNNLNDSNRGLVNFTQASLGDGMTDEQIREVEALNGLLGQDFDMDKYVRTFKPGAAPVARIAAGVAPPPPPQPNAVGVKNAATDVLKEPEKAATNSVLSKKGSGAKLPTWKDAEKVWKKGW